MAESGSQDGKDKKSRVCQYSQVKKSSNDGGEKTGEEKNGQIKRGRYPKKIGGKRNSIGKKAGCKHRKMGENKKKSGADNHDDGKDKKSRVCTDSNVQASSKDGGENAGEEKDGQIKRGSEPKILGGKKNSIGKKAGDKHGTIGKNKKKSGDENHDDGEDKKKPENMKDRKARTQMKG